MPEIESELVDQFLMRAEIHCLFVLFEVHPVFFSTIGKHEPAACRYLKRPRRVQISYMPEQQTECHLVALNSLTHVSAPQGFPTNTRLKSPPTLPMEPVIWTRCLFPTQPPNVYLELAPVSRDLCEEVGLPRMEVADEGEITTIISPIFPTWLHRVMDVGIVCVGNIQRQRR